MTGFFLMRKTVPDLVVSRCAADVGRCKVPKDF